MFKTPKQVFLKETDASGILYFNTIFDYAVQSFESFLLEKQIALSDFFSQGYQLPIVHAEADFKAPILLGQWLELQLRLERLGTNSFTLACDIFNKSSNTLSGHVKLVHAFKHAKQNNSSEIPKEIRELLLRYLSTDT